TPSEADALHLGLPEALQLQGDRVGAGRNRGEGKEAVRVGHRPPLVPRRFVRERHVGAGQDGARLVDDRAAQLAREPLGVRDGRHDQRQRQDRDRQPRQTCACGASHEVPPRKATELHLDPEETEARLAPGPEAVKAVLRRWRRKRETAFGGIRSLERYSTSANAMMLGPAATATYCVPSNM